MFEAIEQHAQAIAPTDFSSNGEFMNEQKLDAMKAFQLADDAWQAELERVYEKRAGDARYISKLNGATAELEVLRSVRNEAMKAYEYQQIRQRVAAAAVYV